MTDPQGTGTSPPAWRGRFLARGVWGLASQGTNALGNMLAAVFVASNNSSENFGAWAVGYAVVLTALPIARSVGATPMLLTSHKHQQTTEAGAVSSGFWFGVATAVGMAAVALAIDGPLRSVLLAFAVALPFFLLQDTLRYVFISRQRPSRTALMDSTWLFIQSFGFVGLHVLDLANAPAATLVWAGSALLSCFWASGSGAASVDPRTALNYMRRNRWASSRLFPDSLLNGLSTNVTPVLLAAVGGLSGTAALRAGQTLFGPLNIFIAGLSPILTVEAVRSLRRGASQWRLVRLWSAGIAAVGALCGVAVLALPDSIGGKLLGDSWELVPIVALPLAIQAVLRGPFVCGPLVLRARHLLNEALALRAVNSIVSLIVPPIGIFVDGARGAAWGIAIAAILNGTASMAWLWGTRGRTSSDLAGDESLDAPPSL